MSFTVRFRSVGVYAFFPDIKIKGDIDDYTISQIMDEIHHQKSQGKDKWDYTTSYFAPREEYIISSIGYKFVKDTSERPPNSKNPTEGYRKLGLNIDKVFEGDFIYVRAWQYYRSITGHLKGSGTRITINLPSQKDLQPLATKTKFWDKLRINRHELPLDFKIDTYDITWRQVTVPKVAARYGLNFEDFKASFLALQSEPQFIPLPTTE